MSLSVSTINSIDRNMDMQNSYVKEILDLIDDCKEQGLLEDVSEAELQQLVDQGNTVIIIEHNLDILKSVDYIIDLGPDGGRKGGMVVAKGTPEEIAANPSSVTGPFLREVLPRS